MSFSDIMYGKPGQVGEKMIKNGPRFHGENGGEIRNFITSFICLFIFFSEDKTSILF